MTALLVAVAAALGVGAIFYLRKPQPLSAHSREVEMIGPKGEPKKRTLDEIFADNGERFGVDPLLLKAIAMAESSLNPSALRNNPPRDVSAGLMQVLCIPDANGYCKNQPDISLSDYDPAEWSAVTLEAMYDPEISVYWGARILSSYLRDYGYPKGVARYNMRAARDAPLNGPFPNQAYVNKVLSNYRKLKGMA